MQQRPLRGSRISSFYPVKNLPSLASLDSAFQLQEYISLLIRLDVHDVAAIVSVPGKSGGKEKDIVHEGEAEKDDELKDRKSEMAVDEACWIYEQLRRLAQDLTHPLITALQQECTRDTCPEMKAGEWLYLCVAHGDDGAREQCCAIDYILHTLDSATALLNSPRAFPSRLSIPQTSHRHFSSLARRLGRIFAHAYFHHREAFEQAEAESSLYARFLALTSQFDLVPAEFLVIPIPQNHGEGRDDMDVQPPRLLGAAIHPQPTNLLPEHEWEHVEERAKSTSPQIVEHQIGTESPRRGGRNRTDTMVFNEAATASDELTKFDETGKEHPSDQREVDEQPSSQPAKRPPWHIPDVEPDVAPVQYIQVPPGDEHEHASVEPVSSAFGISESAHSLEDVVATEPPPASTETLSDSIPEEAAETASVPPTVDPVQSEPGEGELVAEHDTHEHIQEDQMTATDHPAHAAILEEISERGVHSAMETSDSVMAEAPLVDTPDHTADLDHGHSELPVIADSATQESDSAEPELQTHEDPQDEEPVAATVIDITTDTPSTD